MMGTVGCRAPEFLPVQLRLDGLGARLAHARQMGMEADERLTEGLSTDLRVRIEVRARTQAMFGIRRGVSGLVKTLCLELDGSLPDGDDWYAAALRQLQGAGKGRRPILSADLGAQLLELDLDPSCPNLDLPEEEVLERLKAQLAMARDLVPGFEALMGSLNADFAAGYLFDGRPPDPEFTADHERRQANAARQCAALEQAWARIKGHCDSLGRRVVLFGSFPEGRVRGRSDLDLFLPETGLPDDARRQLWDAIEDLAKKEGVMADVHFADIYDAAFAERIKVIVDGSIRPLRVLVTGEPE